MKGPLQDTTVVVPFRLGSRRFPGKALVAFDGQTLLEHALDKAAALGARQLVLTAPKSDLEVVTARLDLSAWGATAISSSVTCRCATQRLVEIRGALDGDRFLSLPIDEPALDPREILTALGASTQAREYGAVTFYCDFFALEDYRSPLSAKMVLDARGRLLYMSRAVIPVHKDGAIDEVLLKKNVGATWFRRSFLDRLDEQADSPTVLDRHEGLEQLRWLELGLEVLVLKIRHVGVGIDTQEQIAELEERLRCL